MVAPEGCQLGVLDLGQLPALELHDAGRRLVQRGENVEQGRFSAARLAHDRKIFAALDAEIDVVQRLDLIAAEARGINFPETGNL